VGSTWPLCRSNRKVLVASRRRAIFTNSEAPLRLSNSRCEAAMRCKKLLKGDLPRASAHLTARSPEPPIKLAATRYKSLAKSSISCPSACPMSARL
jgi:hypothetical protein